MGASKLAKGFNPAKEAKKALEAGDKHKAYRLHHLAMRQEANLGDFDLEGFKPSFYKGLAPYRGKDGKMYSIDSDEQTLKNIPVLAGKFAKALSPFSILDSFNSKKKILEKQIQNVFKPKGNINSKQTKKINKTYAKTSTGGGNKGYTGQKEQSRGGSAAVAAGKKAAKRQKETYQAGKADMLRTVARRKISILRAPPK